MRRCAVLFDGAGLARLGIEQSGAFDEVVGVELDPVAHYLSTMVGSGRCVRMDARQFDLTGFDAVWASPPCVLRSDARTQGEPEFGHVADDLLDWTLSLGVPCLWVENVWKNGRRRADNAWGTVYNAAQFDPVSPPRQNRLMILGGRHPMVFAPRPFQRVFPGVCPKIMATEYKGGANDRARASRFFGRRLTLDEAADRMGFTVPDGWRDVPQHLEDEPSYNNGGKRCPFTPATWAHRLYRAIGNGVPVWVARAFAEAYAAANRGS